jgi:peptidoglycan/LPS O-acetylase OafA/YrhL
MALAISERYRMLPGWRLRLYANRALRLLPAYWVVVIATFILAAGFGLGTWTSHRFARGDEQVMAQVGGPLAMACVLLSTLTIVGQDLGDLFAPGGEKLGANFLVGQAWSVGTEIWFFALVPFLVPRQIR